jgi:hypothetical protein
LAFLHQNILSGKNIFIAPLDWGFGHATRCVPLIRQLGLNNKLFVGVTPLNRFYFEPFPGINLIELPTYGVRYSRYFPAWLSVVAAWPRLLTVIRTEKRLLKEIIVRNRIEVVISDNRFGLINKNVKCIFMTHQLNIKSPFFSGFANYLNKKYINRFDEVWIPDLEEKDERLSGSLSDAAGIIPPVRYIGPQSALPVPAVSVKLYDFLILLSGVEPQRTELESILCRNFRKVQASLAVVRGAHHSSISWPEGVHVRNFVRADELSELIGKSDTIVCRSGYSTLMDLHVTGASSIILVPTPGQPEQEYLARYRGSKSGTISIKQNEIKKINFNSFVRQEKVKAG